MHALPPARFAVAARCVAGALGGAALGLAFHPGPLGILAWAAFVPLLWAIDGEPPRRAFAWGAVFGACAYGFGAPWAFLFVRRFLNVSGPEAFVWFCALCALQGLRWGLCAALAARAPWGARRAAAFACAAVAAEFYLPTLFPSALAVTQTFDLPLLQIVSRVGNAGPAWLILGANAALFVLLRERRARAAAPAALLLAAGLGARLWGRREMAAVEAASAAAPFLRAGLVQGGARLAAEPLADRFSQDLPLYGALSRRAALAGAADLIVWPESTFAPLVTYDLAAPRGARADGRPFSQALSAAELPATPLLLNAIGRAPDGRDRNLSVLLDAPHAPVDLVEKRTLAPFGEYMPRGLDFLRRFSPRTGRLAPGAGPRLLAVSGARLGLIICYESASEEAAAGLAALGADALVSQANDAWFGEPLAPNQHLQTNVLLAVENRRALLHAAMTGVSAIVLPSGRIAARLDAGVSGALAAALPLGSELTGAAARSRILYRLAAALSLAGLVFARR